MNAPAPDLTPAPLAPQAAPQAAPERPARAARILVVDDVAANLRLICDRLVRAGYQASGAADGPQALALAASWQPDLVLLDVVMPGMDGYAVCRALRAMPGFAAVPIVMLTALEATAERVRGLEAERLVAESGDDPMRSHRAEVSVLFADLRGFTAFAETASPDQVMTMLGQFHEAMGRLIFACDGTLERFTGDGMMVFFNDPDPMPDHAWRAVQLGLAMQAAMPPLLARWQGLGGLHGLAVGISRGPATLGAIGFQSRIDYAAIGSVTNRAARLCGEAQANQVLICAAVRADLGERLPCVALPPVTVKGFAQPIAVYRAGPALA